MIILDTNVISQFFRTQPDAKVLAWLRNQDPDQLYITSITVLELFYGAFLLPVGKRRETLEAKIQLQLKELFWGKVLAFDQAAATHCAALMVAEKADNSKAKLADMQIAGIAKYWDAALATGNVSDFRKCNLTVINPWAD